MEQLIPLINAEHSLNESLYPSLAQKLKKEALEVNFAADKEYSLPLIERYAYLRKLTLTGIGEKIQKRDLKFYEYLKLGDFVFRIHHIDFSKFQITYKLTETYQPSLF